MNNITKVIDKDMKDKVQIKYTLPKKYKFLELEPGENFIIQEEENINYNNLNFDNLKIFQIIVKNNEETLEKVSNQLKYYQVVEKYKNLIKIDKELDNLLK